jgi:predicted RNase H-like HicB family nuclease
MSKNCNMSINTPSDVLARMQEAAEKAAKGIRDVEEMRKASEDMDRISEEVRRRNGILDIGVRTIRELRDA